MNEKYNDDYLNSLIDKAEEADIESLYLLGGDYLNEGCVDKSVACFEKIHNLEEGVVDDLRFRGAYGMVCCYQYQGDVEKQVFWYVKAADRGYVAGYYRAALLLNDKGIKLEYLKRGASKGHLPSKIILFTELRDREKSLFRKLKWSFLMRFHVAKFLVARKKNKNSDLVKC